MQNSKSNRFIELLLLNKNNSVGDFLNSKKNKICGIDINFKANDFENEKFEKQKLKEIKNENEKEKNKFLYKNQLNNLTNTSKNQCFHISSISNNNYNAKNEKKNYLKSNVNESFFFLGDPGINTDNSCGIRNKNDLFVLNAKESETNINEIRYLTHNSKKVDNKTNIKIEDMKNNEKEANDNITNKNINKIISIITFSKQEFFTIYPSKIQSSCNTCVVGSNNLNATSLKNNDSKNNEFIKMRFKEINNKEISNSRVNTLNSINSVYSELGNFTTLKKKEKERIFNTINSFSISKVSRISKTSKSFSKRKILKVEDRPLKLEDYYKLKSKREKKIIEEEIKRKENNKIRFIKMKCNNSEKNFNKIFKEDIPSSTTRCLTSLDKNTQLVNTKKSVRLALNLKTSKNKLIRNIQNMKLKVNNCSKIKKRLKFSGNFNEKNSKLKNLKKINFVNTITSNNNALSIEEISFIKNDHQKDFNFTVSTIFINENNKEFLKNNHMKNEDDNDDKKNAINNNGNSKELCKYFIEKKTNNKNKFSLKEIIFNKNKFSREKLEN